MVEVARTTPFAGPGVTRHAADVYPWAGGEIAAALTLTTRTADRELEFAETLVLRLPRVFTALSAGLLDRGKAWVFADQLHPLACGLTDEQIDALCERLVPPAAGWTTGQLAARLLRAIIAIDPEHAGRRYTKAIRERQVVAYLAADGTVTITASGLPTDQAAAACERLERLAAAVKRAGHPARLAQIHAELFRGGHAPGHLREMFCVYVDTDVVPVDELYDRSVLVGRDPVVWLCGQLWNCTDTVPGELRSDLGDRADTYAQAARLKLGDYRRAMA